MNSFPSWLSLDALARDYPLRPRRKYRSFVSILYLRWTWKDVKKGTTLFREVDRCRRFKDTEVCHSYLPHNVSHPRSKTAGISMEAIHRGWIESERERERAVSPQHPPSPTIPNEFIQRPYLGSGIFNGTCTLIGVDIFGKTFIRGRKLSQYCFQSSTSDFSSGIAFKGSIYQ